MNLRQTDLELRLHMQQIDIPPTPASERAPNPFTAALGIGVVVVLVWFLFVLGPIARRVISLVCQGVDFTLSLF